MNRRVFLAASAAGVLSAQTPTANFANLKPMTGGIQPISEEERLGRMEKARRLMQANKIGAIVCQGGASLFYYTGVRWPSVASLAWVLPAKGDAGWMVAAGEVDQARQAMRLSADRAGTNIRTFAPDDDAAYARIAQFLQERGASGRIGIEEKSSFALFDGMRRQAPALEFVSADPVTVGCRVIKSPAEIALMQRANDITIAAYKAALGTLKEGMTNRELSANIAAAYTALGAPGNAMVNFGEYTAYPHGSIQPQHLREGDFVLMDDGCTVDGYQSDITRTLIFGKPTARQRQVWELERKAQDAALAAAKPGATCESVDAAARKVITDAGFGPGYKVPGLPHRTGHGIGLEGHEWTNLVKGNKTKIEPGMCFSDEPTIAIYGEFGVRLEDCMHITPEGARMFTAQSPAIDQPFG
jgi:Xaa-Pro dipeptidase